MKRIGAVGLLFVLIFILSTSSSTASFKWFGPSGCIWATAPALYGSPITGDDLRKCVSDLISGIQDQNKQLERLQEAQEMVSLQFQIINNLENNMREIEKRLESIESIIASEVIEKGRRR
jgi:TolA-binding protein